MSSKPFLTQVPGSPALVRRVVPVVAAAAVVTGCIGCPGGLRQTDGGGAVFDAGRSRPPDAFAAPVEDATVVDVSADDGGNRRR